MDFASVVLVLWDHCAPSEVKSPKGGTITYMDRKILTSQADSARRESMRSFSGDLSLDGHAHDRRLSARANRLRLSLARGGTLMKRSIVARVLFVALPASFACGVDGDVRTSPVELALQTISHCPDGFNIIEGTNLDDNLRGTNGDDCILGYDGNDVIRGRRGDDYLVGGQGEDRIYGDDGNDQIFGEDGADTIRGDRGDDTIQGGSGADVLQGDDGNDDISGGDGADLLEGGQGHDELAGDDGNDEISGDRGADVLNGGDGDDVLSGGDGKDVVYGGAGDDTISDPSGEDVITDNVGSGAVTASLNTWPVVESIVPVPTRLDVGDTTALTVNVFDPDGDPMTFFWTADCVGMFITPNSFEPKFTLAAIDGDRCTLVLQVSDTRGGETTGSITIATGTIGSTEEATP
jgi:hypothetical protein